jgi:hypothetical protein
VRHASDTPIAMKLRFVGVFAFGSVVSCAQMQRDWEAQQAAMAQAQANAAPANMEQLCTAVKNSYCSHCNVAAAACGQTYINCLGQSSPADPSAFNAGGVNECAAAVSVGDCNVMPRVWPASCSVPTQQPEQQQQQAQDETPACPEGSSWDGAQCVCMQGTGWNGQACMPIATSAPPPPPPPRLPSCRALVIEKGYGPSATENCKGADAFCAKAVLDKGYGVSALSNCRGVNSRCAMMVIDKGYGPSALANCQRVETRCAVEVLEKGYGPSALTKCKR